MHERTTVRRLDTRRSSLAEKEEGAQKVRKNKIVLRQLAHRKSETCERKRTEPRKGVSLALDRWPSGNPAVTRSPDTLRSSGSRR
jgi:hypothetical protein